MKVKMMSEHHKKILNIVINEWEELGNSPEEFGAVLYDACFSSNMEDKYSARTKLRKFKYGQELIELELRQFGSK